MDTMVISPDSTIEKQKNQHTHNFERTAPPSSFIFIWFVQLCTKGKPPPMAYKQKNKSCQSIKLKKP